MSFDPSKMASPAGTAQSVDLDKVMDYNCSGWTVDNSMFAPPANVKFSEVGVMTAPSGAPTGISVQNKCSVCDALPADAKAQCRTALKCN